MARDGLFFKAVGKLNDKHVPLWGLIVQGIWAAGWILPRRLRGESRGNATGYGTLYANLLDYWISAALIFYVLPMAGILRLRKPRRDAERPYKAFGYPIIPI